jgi:hypothetical protein
VLLDQDADEALQAADDGAVQHHRAVAAPSSSATYSASSRSGMEKSTCIVPHCHWRPSASFSVYSILGP